MDRKCMHGFLLCAAVVFANGCLSGCDGGGLGARAGATGGESIGNPVPVPLDDVLRIVGGMWVDSPIDRVARNRVSARDPGGPTVGPPRVVANSPDSFDIEITEVEAPYTLGEITQLRIAVDEFLGHYVLDVSAEHRTDSGSMLVTVVRERALDHEFVLQLVAVDAQGLEGEIVEASTAFFSASAGEDAIVSIGRDVELHAVFTGGTGTPRVEWTQVAGPGVALDDSLSASTTFVPKEAATYVMRLGAVDPTGILDVDLVTILAVEMFTVEAGESRVIVVGETVELRGSAGGGSGQATFAWTEISHHGISIENPASRIATFVPPEAGEYEFQLTAIDEAQGAAFDRVIHLAVDGLTAQASAPADAARGETIQLVGEVAGGSPPYAFRWSQRSGPTVTIRDRTNQTALVTLTEVGTYEFRLLVEDSMAFDASAAATTVQCDDGVFCNGQETCQDGECRAGPEPCPTGEECDEVSDSCTPCACDDGDPCTEDACGTDGECVFTPKVCDDGLYCNGLEFCNERGECEAGEIPCCGNPCNEANDACVLAVVLVSSRDNDKVLAYNGYTGTYIRDLVDATDGIDYPNGMAFDDDGYFYVANVGTDSVFKRSLLTGEPVLECTGGLLDGPDGVLLGPDMLLVSSYATDSVERYDLASGVWLDSFVPPGSGGLDAPSDLIWSGAGNLLVSSGHSDQVLEYDGSTGGFVGVRAGGDRLDYPYGLLEDGSGDLLVASYSTDEILRYEPDGTYLGPCVTAGSGGLDMPTDLAWASNGDLLVASGGTNRILAYDRDTCGYIGPFSIGGVLARPNHIATTTVLDPDCNCNGIIDQWDIDTGPSEDVNGNGVPDECES